jgi:hypothetical protein
MRDFWPASFVCLFIALAISVVIACSHRYSLVASGSTAGQGVVYRIDHWTGRVALIRPDFVPDSEFDPNDPNAEGFRGVKIYDGVRFVPSPTSTPQ